ncbi:MAG: bifunctional diaminohydroxyphosphoribosylaminopyrimidine deaminase/5-amino-6-(5-phosphoribosylamino)uracil reductase RibD [Nitratireductor sp.]
MMPTDLDFTDADRAHMRAALALAARGLGRTAPNPSVGCVLVRQGRVLGRGWTQPGGRPHAETEALRRAGDAARGATAYVTLEPCSHYGKTPPCADALIAAGVARVVAALVDPDRRVSGSGLARLQGAGVETACGLMAREAEALNRGYILQRTARRPLVTLKLATSLDGKIALASGESRWITGEAARAEGRLLRARHDAVAVGIGTALADDPSLTVRLPGLEGAPQPLRVVFDSRARLPADAKLAIDGAAETLVLTGPGAPARIGGAETAACRLDAAGRIDVEEALALLAARGITRLMVEGGGELAAALLRADLIDEIWWFRAGLVIGADGAPGVGPLGLGALREAGRLTLREARRVDRDLLEVWARP